MASIHKLRRLGSNKTGEKAGIELPRDDLQLEGLLDEDGELVSQPNLAITRVRAGEWRIKRLDRVDTDE
jgi:hypothetical protein